MQGKFFNGRIGMECRGSGAVEKREEDTRFLRENADRL